MEWFSWLSQTPLEPSLVYNYGVLFACNELTLDDVVYFDHDLLLSMGVVIAKHRLHILNLARTKPLHIKKKLPRFMESFANRFKQRKTPTEAEPQPLGRPPPLKVVEWKDEEMGTPGVKKQSRKYVSGPINGGRPLPARARSPRLSGPLDRRSSFGREQSDGSESHSPWAMLFDDLKPN